MNKIYIYLENGTFLEANSFGASGTAVGEIVFNTSMTGYQEIITDPSYAGQFVTFTTPEIGNVGVNDDDMESTKAHCKGVLVRNYQKEYSNYRSNKALHELLEENNTLGICDIDTRYLTKMLRDEGAMMMIASTEISNKDELKAKLELSPRIEDINYIEQVSTKETYVHKSGAWNQETQSYNKAIMSDKKVVVIDFGVKRNILNELVESGLEVEVIPSNFDADTLINRFNNGEIGGVFLSNGPGDPLTLTKEKEQVQKLIKTNIPMFAICLGHQMLSIAHGFDTFKLKFGQHGGNHPVAANGVVEITAQNHNYNVPDEIIQIAEITHQNLFDNTIEGVKYNDKNIFSVQHHPEASPGPHESKYIFDEFAKTIK
ncbi:MAG: glutamine-hydrolyzing carbamoyl-phosphate synthase small subunit [Campylobacteraceae bacterium]|jgi:carbamoyl-phosphate synthase small subunit|nr:glutamine-hydrolyzing carbamoyl-phosphate synthase small subunit [Campylobacteraceae bacterium]MBT3882085.1 glutamine-hydrolyzing carbamoyl-phosphate synthase small subunit [Campylobacteraceae bacterium]MBT4029920.1 glutamine-hydrolyzing carbamoyl-phosphate synthase small subunit [Campylobacteraceae bacterium]MBT4572153.1 glutamine-hydrolyzing carbamoyl-phosphate synthase small subunit [Campylobacteraceae bacterium]MBT4707305.1 glutamine-hydrolyzing carbamoyl-phosphate synthase small subunit